MRIYFNVLLIPIVAATLPLFWHVLRDERARLWLVICVSLAVLAALHPIFALIATSLVVLVHQIVAAHHEQRITGARAIVIALITTLTPLAIGKYGRSAAVALWGSGDPVVAYFIMPLGISYFAFRLLQYVFDQVRGVITENSLLRLSAFVLFLPMLPAGPIETYGSFYAKRSAAFDRGLFERGLRRIAVGYFKKIVIVNSVLSAVFASDFLREVARGTIVWRDHPLRPAAFVVVSFVNAYFDLSAYTDLAIGFSALYGFRIMENFDWPFWKPNLMRFWQSWHISLSTWCRNNVYFPVLGATRKPALAAFATMLAMGVWHYANLNWIAWALYHGAGLSVVGAWNRYTRRSARMRWRRWRLVQCLSPAMRWCSSILTFGYVALGYAFVSTPSIATGARLFVVSVAGPWIWLAGLIK